MGSLELSRERRLDRSLQCDCQQCCLRNISNTMELLEIAGDSAESRTRSPQKEKTSRACLQCAEQPLPKFSLE